MQAPRVCCARPATATGATALLALEQATSLYVVGRGLGLGIAQEMALKFKETCRIHAEAFSAAEVLHGPLALVGPGFPAFVLDPGDEGSASTRAVADSFSRLGAHVAFVGAGSGGGAQSAPCRPTFRLPLVPLAQIRAFYGAVARSPCARGLDPDNPPHLRKVTRTT